MKTKLEIIEEVEKQFSSGLSSRAYEDMSCFYAMPDNRRCAVGMFFKKDIPAEDYHGSCDCLIHTPTREKVQLDSVLQEDVQGHPVEFWEDLQEFHDSERNFTETGYSEKGLFELKQLKNKWGQESPKNTD